MCRATAPFMRKHSPLWILAFLTACGGADDGGTAIGPNGGTVTSADGTLTLRFPPGAVANETAIKISPGRTDRFLPDTSWQIEPAGLVLSAPVVVEMKLDRAVTEPLVLAYATDDGRFTALGHSVTNQGVLRATLDTLKRPEEGLGHRELGACPVPPVLEIEALEGGTTTVRAIDGATYPIVLERAITSRQAGTEPTAFAVWRTLYAGEIAIDDTSAPGRYTYRAVTATPPCVGLPSASATIDSTGEPAVRPLPASTTITAAPMLCGGIEIAVFPPDVVLAARVDARGRLVVAANDETAARSRPSPGPWRATMRPAVSIRTTSRTRL